MPWPRSSPHTRRHRASPRHCPSPTPTGCWCPPSWESPPPPWSRHIVCSLSGHQCSVGLTCPVLHLKQYFASEFSGSASLAWKWKLTTPFPGHCPGQSEPRSSAIQFIWYALDYIHILLAIIISYNLLADRLDCIFIYFPHILFELIGLQPVLDIAYIPAEVTGLGQLFCLLKVPVDWGLLEVWRARVSAARSWRKNEMKCESNWIFVRIQCHFNGFNFELWRERTKDKEQRNTLHYMESPGLNHINLRN